MQKKSIWIVTELFYPEETTVAVIFTRIANFLSNDYEINVICGPEFYDKNKVNFKDKYDLSDKITVYRTNTINLDKNSLIQRTLKVLLLSFQMSFMVLKKVPKNGTVILATNPAPLLILISFIKIWKNIQLHILVHDVFPENTIPAQIFRNDKSLIYKGLKRLFDKAYSRADHLISIGRDMQEVLLKKTIRFRKRPSISVVPNWSNSIDTKLDLNIKSLYAKHQNKIIFQYSGNIGRVQGLDVLIDAFLAANNPNTHLIIRGTGALYPSIENLIESKNIENITLLGGFSRNQESEILSDCHISIVSLSRGMFGLGVPSKTYNLLAAGKPILFLGEPNSEISLMINEFKIGWSFNISNKKEIIEFFNSLGSESIPDIMLKGEMARSLSENQFEENNVLNLLKKQIEKHFL